MKRRAVVISSILFFAVFMGMKFAHAFFSDAAQSTGNTFVASGAFPTVVPTITPTFAPTSTPTPSPTVTIMPSPTPSGIANNIVINEVYYRIATGHRIGSSESGSEWAELYNPTGSTVSLAGLSIEDNTSCDNFSGSPSLSAGNFAIISSHTEAEFRAVWTSIPSGVLFIQTPSAIGNGLANNDELILRNGTCSSGATVIDHISWGSNTNGLNPSIPTVPSGISSERNPDGKDTGSNSDFIQSNPPTPGS